MCQTTPPAMEIFVPALFSLRYCCSDLSAQGNLFNLSLSVYLSTRLYSFQFLMASSTNYWHSLMVTGSLFMATVIVLEFPSTTTRSISLIGWDIVILLIVSSRFSFSWGALWAGVSLPQMLTILASHSMLVIYVVKQTSFCQLQEIKDDLIAILITFHRVSIISYSFLWQLSYTSRFKVRHHLYTLMSFSMLISLQLLSLWASLLPLSTRLTSPSSRTLALVI